MGSAGVFLLALLLAAAVFYAAGGARRLWRRRGEYRGRRQAEDALKHVLAWQHRAKAATPESLAGALGLSPQAVLQLITRMETAGTVESVTGGIRLTPRGEKRALQVVRAHRLWERYLSDDANMPLGRVHRAAERAEHRLSGEAVAELDAHLGHPRRDPHGDPIPTAEGFVAPLDAVSLSEWRAGDYARIVHIEDEPDAIFRQIAATGLRPGQVVRVAAAGGREIVVNDGEREHRLAPAVAANIQAAAAPASAMRPPEAMRLSRLPRGVRAEVVELDEACRGFSRRRLLDLGLTPKTEVEAVLDNTFGDPRAFRIRGTVIALRGEQADSIRVRLLPEAKTPEAAAL